MRKIGSPHRFFSYFKRPEVEYQQAEGKDNAHYHSRGTNQARTRHTRVAMGEIAVVLSSAKRTMLASSKVRSDIPTRTAEEIKDSCTSEVPGTKSEVRRR